MPDIVKGYLNNINTHKRLNAFVEVFEVEAMEQAESIQAKFRSGTAGQLAGMVVGLKDVFSYKNHKLECSSGSLEGFTAQYHATVVQRLLDEDAIIIGRQNCDEFAMGSSNETSARGPVHNAADMDHVPGGSSGGSAVAVQANMCLASIGSDTGGSVRQPAAYCGVIGLKPTYSRVSRYGLTAYASSFDCVGTITRSVEDASKILEVVSGADEYDSTVANRPAPKTGFSGSYSQKLRIAVLENTLSGEGLDETVGLHTQKVLDNLKEEGHEISLLNFKYLPYMLPTYYVLTTAEASANLSRYDGMRFGLRDTVENDLIGTYTNTRSKGFGEEVKKRIMLGTFVLSEGYYDAYYGKAQKVRRMIRDATCDILSEHDFVLLPTTPTPAFKLGSRDRDPLEMYLEDIFTVQASLAGVPAISLPNGKNNDGLPIGIQVLANSFEEEKLLDFSNYLMGNGLLE